MTLQPNQDDRAVAAGAERVRQGLRGRSLVLVGLMGSGKSTVGRRLANRLEMPFVDADTEIERAAGKTIPEIFATHGEPYFRDGERRVIARLLAEGGHVLATGGGAFMDPSTRALIRARGVSVWLKADLDVLMKRVRKRGGRPLLQTPDPEGAMRRLMDERYPVYAEADLTVHSHESPHEVVVDDVIAAVLGHLPAVRPASAQDAASPGP